MKLPVNYNCIGISDRRVVREEYVSRQQGLCKFCGNSLSEDPSDYVLSFDVDRKLFPKNFFKWPVHLHHDHRTGMTIGAVHCYCNAVLWQYYGE